jgi:hypothetical protein
MQFTFQHSIPSLVLPRRGFVDTRYSSPELPFDKSDEHQYELPSVASLWIPNLKHEATSICVSDHINQSSCWLDDVHH